MSDNSMNERPVEVSWFSALCDDDYQFLGVEDPALKASWPHCRDIALTAEKNGFDNILLPSGYQLGMDSIGFAGGIAPLLEQCGFWWRCAAAKCGCRNWPPIGTLDQMLAAADDKHYFLRPARSANGWRAALSAHAETMQALRQFLNGEAVQLDGAHIQLDLPRRACRLFPANVRPFILGPVACRARCRRAEADVFLMWPDTMDKVADILDDMRARASPSAAIEIRLSRACDCARNRSASRDAADQLVSKLDDKPARKFAIARSTAPLMGCAGRLKCAMPPMPPARAIMSRIIYGRVLAGRAPVAGRRLSATRSSAAKLNAYRALGIDAFILSGYPHRDECDLFGRYVLPRLNHGALQL